VIEAVWGGDRDIENNTLDVFMRQLRAKIDVPGSQKLIHTIRGVGYVLREEDGA
jgi:DNA-binding response OmpR family regulator